MPRQIVVIMTDTQRWDMLGCYGNPDMRTPCLDRLAGEGMRFERAYTCQPVCGPARAALFTGCYPHSNGSWGNSMALGDNVKTIGQRLRDQGFHTAYMGKWHLDGGDYFGVGRCPDGWDPACWYDMRGYLEELTPEERLRSRQAATNADLGVPAAFTFGHRVSNRAIGFLQQARREDFLLVVSYDEPHHPYLCPSPYAEMYREYQWPVEKIIPATPEEQPEHQRVWGGPNFGAPRTSPVMPADYLGCNAFVDAEIGRVLDAVQRHAPDALVIYTSDHGDFLGSHGLSGKGPAMYDDITRIPFIVRWPGVTAPGSVCPHPVSHIDLAPTILEFAIGNVPVLLEGRSLCPTLADPARRINDQVFIEFGRYEIDHDGFGGFQPIRCAFDGRYKLVVNLLSSDELYDLERDPNEQRNLIESPADAANRDALHDALLDWMNRTRDPFRGYYWERRPWRADAAPPTWAYTDKTRQRENEEYEPRQLVYETGLPMTSATRTKGY